MLLRSVGVPPVRALEKRPPLTPVAQIDRARRRREDERAGIEHMRQRARIILRVGRNLGKGDVAGCFDEFAELPVRHRRAVHPERVHRDAMNRRLFRIMLIRAHAESAAGNAHHIRVARTRMRQALTVLVRLKFTKQHSFSRRRTGMVVKA